MNCKFNKFCELSKKKNKICTYKKFVPHTLNIKIFCFLIYTFLKI